MKKIISKILLLLLAFSFVFAFTSCGGKSGNVVKIVDIGLTDEEYAFVTKEGNLSLVDSFNSFIAEIKENGEFDKITNKYFIGEGEKVGYQVSNYEVENTEDNLIVVTNCPFAPFEYRDTDGKIYGIDIEIAAAYAKANGLELIIKDIAFNDIFTQIDAGYADIGMAGITVDESREKIYDFTNSYYRTSQKLIVSSQNIDFDNCQTAKEVEGVLSTLNNAKIGYQSATTGNLYINGSEDWGYTGFENIEGKVYQSAQLAVSDLVNGNLYAVILDEAPALSIVAVTNETSGLNFAAKFENFFATLSNEHYIKILLQGLLNTILVAVVGLVIGIVIGTLIAIIRVAPKYKFVFKVLDKICDVYSIIFRGTPMVAQLLIAYYVIIPTLDLKVSALAVGMMVFGMNSGAYVSEIMRGGINSVDKGQMEAGRALGLTYASTMLHIVVPQAIKNILPTLGNEFISLIKETSVLSFIVVDDIYQALLDVGMVKYDSMVPYIMMGIIYVILVLIISIGIKIIERRFAKSDRN